MSIELQNVKRSSNLTKWAEMVRSCKNSGMTVRAWCLEHGVNEKTYYYRQKQLCNALPESAGKSVQFAEVSRPTGNAVDEGVIQIRIGAAEIRADGHTNLDLLREVVRIAIEIC